MTLFEGYTKRLRSESGVTKNKKKKSQKKGEKEEETPPVFVFGATTSLGDEVAVPSAVATLFKSVETASFGGRHPMLITPPVGFVVVVVLLFVWCCGVLVLL